MAVNSGVVSVGTAATKICTSGEGGVMLQNLGTAIAFIGGPSVTPNTAATGGIQLPATMATPVFFPGARIRPSQTVPAGTDDSCDIYGCVAASTQNIAFYAPQGG